MSKKSDYSPEEWKSITGAPYLAGLFITMADPSGIGGVMKEAMAVGKAVAEAGANNQTEVIKSLVEGLKEAGFKAKAELPDIPKGDLATAKAATFDHVQKAITALSAKSPSEVEAYKAWLMTAAKEGLRSGEGRRLPGVRRHAGQRQGTGGTERTGRQARRQSVGKA